jgi:alkanesulfonate monooxygenase SsuD/methylene tetrahydromethanopterin reductase-like flavin-dependent oxidoreductase (luciferase family)
MEKVLIYDMRAPSFGAPARELYAAALDQVAWADELGFDVVGLGEHHGSEDGYNPSPLVLACAMAGRTRRIRFRTSVLLAPFYDPVKLAEDVAVAQLASGGRIILGLGFAYRPPEFAMFGHRVEERWRLTCDACRVLKQAWTGEPFTYQGRPCRVMPRPDPAPPILLGGGTPAAARKAAHIADGWFVPGWPAPDAKIWNAYREECVKLGKLDPGEPPKQAPIFLWVSRDPQRDWEWLLPHVLHVLDSYSRWTSEAYGQPVGPYAGGMTADMVRESPAYKVLTPEKTVALAEGLGDNSSFYVTPLFAGIAPARAWEMLRLYEREVHPYLPRGPVPTWGVRPSATV